MMFIDCFAVRLFLLTFHLWKILAIWLMSQI